MIYFIVLISIVLYRAFMAGMDPEQFKTKWSHKSDPDYDRILGYVMITFGAAVFWPIAIPILIAIKAGKFFSRKKG